MGDMADYDIEQGEDMWYAHLHGDCFEDCIYCEDEEWLVSHYERK